MMFNELLGRLSLRRKFLILGVLGVLLVTPPLYLYLRDTNATIASSQEEVNGIDSGRAALALLQQVQQHRGLSAAYLGAGELAEARQFKQVEVDKALAKLDDQRRGAGADSQRGLAQLRLNWLALHSGVAARTLSVAQSYALHSELCALILGVIEGIADHHGLSLDPDADSYYLMRAAFFDIPALAEALGQTRAMGAGLLASQRADLASRIQLSALVAKVRYHQEHLDDTLTKGTRVNHALKTTLDTPMVDSASAANTALELARDKIIAQDKLQYPTPQYIGLLTRSIDAQFALGSVALTQLDALISHRIAAQQRVRNSLAGAVLLITALSFVIGVLLVRAILRQMGGEPAEAVRIAKRIAVGDLSGTIAVDAGDADSLMVAMQHMSRRIQTVAARADAIGQGDFSQNVALLSEHDLLGHAINNMNALLRAARAEDARRNWLRDGNSQLSAALTGDFSVQQMVSAAISTLGRYMGAGRGALYVYRPQVPALELLGSYMHTGSVPMGRHFKLGEGAAGQVALEKTPIVLSTLQAQVAPITTGTTSALPLYTYTYPLLREGQLLGVVELANFERYDETHLEFLHNATDLIASFLFIADQRERVKNLLGVAEHAEKEARAQSEFLQTANAQLEEQQQQLQQQSEELQQSNAQMEEQQQQLQQQSEELQQSNAQMEEQRQQLEQQNQALRDSRVLMDAKALELERASQYKSEFLANMSHELRTPLNSIILLSKMMSGKGPGGGGDGETAKWSQIIHRSGEDLLRLINDVLDLSKVEAGHVNLQLKALSSQALAAEMHDLFEPIGHDKGVEFVIEDALQGEFLTDRDKLGQIVRNLLSNAFKFTKQGRVTLGMERRVGDALPIRVSVRDSGIGIAPEKQAMVFEAFQQADGSTSREYGGTGLGLTISKRFAESMGGKIELHSAQGQGSEFVVLLPEIAQPIAATPHPAALVPMELGADDRDGLSSADAVILLIDDDLVLGQTLMAMNRRLGYKTLLATTGADGLALARRYRPRGILLDLGLPDMDGRQVLHELKSARELMAIPVYIVSARDRDAALLHQGASGFLQKPVDEAKLADAEAVLLGAVAQVVGSAVLVFENGSISAADVSRIIGVRAGTVIPVMPGAAVAEVQARYTCKLAVVDLADAKVQQGLHIAQQLRSSNPHIALVFYCASAPSSEDEAQLRRYSDSVIVKTAHAEKRLLENMERYLQDGPPPRANAVSVVPEVGATQERRLLGRHVLVADDDPRNLFVLTAALERQGAQVSSVVNGRRALEFLAQHRVDVVLMDIMMPELDGYQTIQAMRSTRGVQDTPVIAITAKAMATDRDKALAAGADDYLSKPVDHDLLIDKVEQWCKGRYP